MISFTVRPEDEGRKILELLAKAYPLACEKTFARACKRGLVTLNGADAAAGDKTKAGDEVCVYLTGDALGVELTLGIVYQDENIVIADKPAGLLSISDDGEPNVLSMTENIMKQRKEYDVSALMVPYMLYPLERHVSGLIIIAKHESVYLFLAQALAQRRITRYFICPTAGRSEENKELLAYHIQNKPKTSVRIAASQTKNAKPIVTRYAKLSSGDGLSLLCVRPITNFLHQIRAHLAFEGLPVIGDSLYGNKSINRRYGADHIALWLNTIVFETGTSHEYAYLNGKTFKSRSHSFPKSVYDAGLLKRT